MNVLKRFSPLVSNIYGKSVKNYIKFEPRCSSCCIPKRHYLPCIRKISTESDPDGLEQIVKEICKDDKQLEKKLRGLMLEVEVMRQDGRKAPSQIKLSGWKYLLSLPSRSQLQRQLQFMWTNEKKTESVKAKKQARKLEYEAAGVPDTREYDDDLHYGLGKGLFIKINDISMNRFDDYRAIQAQMYGEKVVIDCSYDDKMVFREAKNAANQLTFMYGDNRRHKDPFNLYLCNVETKKLTFEQLKINIPTVDEPWFPLNVKSESYLELFPKDKLIYLTPHCKDEMTHYDPDMVYIIGCLVDKANNEPLSLAKAKREGLKMQKLPLDRYLEWGLGKKSLNINHMVNILLDLKTNKDWDFALRHVPRRKVQQNAYGKHVRYSNKR